MIRKTISKYGLALHIALLAAAPSALTSFVGADVLAKILFWLSALGLIWLLSEPSIRSSERPSESRERVRRGILRDPIFYFLLAAVVFAFIRWLNNGVALAYDPEQSTWLVKEPAAPIMPASVGEIGFLPFALAVDLLVVLLGIRHGLGAAARISCAMLAAFFSALAGLVGLAECCLETPAFVASASVAAFKDVPFWGAMFGPWLLVGIGAGAAAEVRKWGGARLVFILSVAGNGAGLAFFSPPLLAAAYLALALVFVVFCLVYMLRAGSAGAAARGFAFVVLGLAVPVIAFLSLVPENVLAAKQSGLDPALALPETWRETSAVLSRLAQGLWMKQPWCGAGVGAFELHVPFLAEKADWDVLPSKVTIAYNGYRLLLAERGIVGAAFFAVGLGFLLWFFASRLFGAGRALRAKDESLPLLFAVPPFVWAALPATALFAVEALVSPVFYVGTPIVSVVTLLALAAASFPRAEKAERTEGADVSAQSLSKNKES